MSVKDSRSQSVQLQGVIFVVVRVLRKDGHGFWMQMRPEIIGPNLHRIVQLVESTPMREIQTGRGEGGPAVDGGVESIHCNVMKWSQNVHCHQTNTLVD